MLLRQEDARRVGRRVVLQTQQHVVDEELRVRGGAGARIDVHAQVRRRAREAAHAPDGGSNSWWKFRRQKQAQREARRGSRGGKFCEHEAVEAFDGRAEGRVAPALRRLRGLALDPLVEERGALDDVLI